MESAILLRNGTLLDTDHDRITADILIENGIISAVEQGIAVSAAPQVIDLGGYTVLPGIFNNHVHFVDPSGAPDKTFCTAHMREWAMRGVTGVRDMGIDPKYRTYEDYRSWKEDISGPETPDLFSYGYFQHLCPLRMPKDMPPPPPPPPGAEIPKKEPFELVGSVENARAAAKMSMEMGCQGVKIHGFAREPELMRQICAMAETAESYGGFVSAHINTSDETMVLVECGAHEAAHIAHDITPDADIDRMAEKDFMCCPTASAYTRMYRDKMLTEPMYEAVLRNIERYHKAGIRLTVGTDFMGTIDAPYEDVGIPVFEMKVMASCGMSVQDVITAATLNSAYLCGVSQEVGKLSPGYRANLIAVQGKVDETFEALNDVSLVLNKGVILKNQ